MPSSEALLNDAKYPVQIIWGGKPYPVDYPAISEFNHLVHLSKGYKNVAVVIGYELGLDYVESGPLVRSSYHSERHVIPGYGRNQWLSSKTKNLV